MKVSIKSNFKQSRKMTTFQQLSSQIYLPLVESLLKLIYPQILQIKNTSFDIINNKVKNKFSVKKCEKQKQNKYIQLFMNHCALLIQSNFKGFIQRKKYKKFLPIYRRFKQIFVASIKGWKTRKILSLTAMKKQKIQIIKNVQLKKQKEVRIAKRQYIDDFNRLFKNGNWIQILKKQPKYEFKRVSIVKKNTQWNGKNSLLYDNVKAVTNLRNFLKIQKQKIQKFGCSQQKNKDFIKKKHQNNLNKGFNNQKQNLQNDQKKQKSISQFDKTIKNSKLKGKIQNQKNQSMQNNGSNLKIKNSTIKLKGKLIQNQLQIHIEPQIASKTDSFATPKYSQNLLKRKRTLNVGNSQKLKNYQETLNKDEKQNNMNRINDKQPFDKKIYPTKDDHISNQQNQRLINALQKKRQKKGLGMTLSKHFQFEIGQFTSLNNTKKIDFSQKQKQNQTSQFDETSKQEGQNTCNIKTKSNAEITKINKLCELKQNFNKKVEEQMKRQKQIQNKIQMLKKTNTLI